MELRIVIRVVEEMLQVAFFCYSMPFRKIEHVVHCELHN